MARDGAMWPILGTIDTHRRLPSRALWVQAVISIALVVSGRFEELYAMVSLAMVVTGALTVASLFVLRRSEPTKERPYRAAGYPWFPGFYIVASVAVVAVMLRDALSGTEGAWYPLLGPGVLIAAYVLHRHVLSRSS
jgi:APA family basic amino acid/polyamine antiporter